MASKISEPELNLLRREVAESLTRISALEEENQQQRHEICHLKAQIVSLKPCSNEMKSVPWNKLNNSSNIERVGTELRPPPLPTRSYPSRAAPPPPPMPPNMLLGSRSLQRVPELIDLYRLLTRKDANRENRTNYGVTALADFSKNIIGEIEIRSTYLSGIKSDVEKQKEFINFLIKEVESAAFVDICDVELFVKWLDEQLSSLVDERAVLKHFPQWPERKADALREAACNFRDLRNLQDEVLLYEDNLKEPSLLAFRRMQALQDRLERGVSNIERTRDATKKRYRDFQIPWEWMFETGLTGQMKLSSLSIAKKYMKRVVTDLQVDKEENVLLQGVRFAYRVHQFAGGFDRETSQAFQELKKCSLEK